MLWGGAGRAVTICCGRWCPLAVAMVVVVVVVSTVAMVVVTGMTNF